jgi:PAS domain S-box-containing protein
LGLALASAAALAALTWAADRLGVRPQPAAVLYLALVVLVALRGETAPALVVAVVGTAVWDVVFTGPTVTPGARLFRDLVTLVIYGATAVVISRLVTELRTSEGRWRNVFENNPTMYLMVDADGTVRAVNRLGAEQLGYAVEDLVGRFVLDVFAEEDRASAREFLAECLAHVGVSMTWEGRKVRRDGTRLNVREMARGVRLGDDAPFILLACEDVTEREGAEAARRRGEAYLAEAQRLSHTGSFGWYPDTGEIHWSAETYQIYEVDPATWPNGALVLKRAHPDDRDRLRAVADAMRQGAEHIDFVYRTMTPGGAVKHVHIVSRAVTDATGRRELVGAVMDVTRRREAEAERQAHLWFLESLDSVNRAMQGATDLEQMVRDMLDVSLEVFAADQAGLAYPCDPDAPAWAFVVVRTRPEAADAFAEKPGVPRTPETLKVMRMLLERDAPVQFGPGGEHPLPESAARRNTRSLLATCIRPRGDEPYYFRLGQTSRARVWTPEEVRLFREIGRRLADALTSVKIQRALRASEARFRTLVEHDEALIGILDERGGRFLYVSPSWTRVLGFRPEEFYAMEEPWSLVHPEDRADVWARFTHVDPGWSGTLARSARLRTRDGRYRSFNGTITDRRSDPAIGGYVLNARDVTDELLLTEQLLQAQKMEAIGQLAGGVAHDFNNLLTVIGGYSDFIRMASPVGDGRRQDAAEIRRAADRAALLTQQLLAFSRRQVLRPAVVAVNAVVDEASRMLRRLIGEDVELELRLAPDAGAVLIDAGQLQQVLMNLAVNARDAMPLGGRLAIETAAAEIARETPAQPAPLAPGPYVRLAVRDTGTGMSPDVLGRIFEPFFTTKEVGIGTGLGLSMVYGIVTQSGGRLRVHSAQRAGTTFEVFFPRVEGPAPGAAAAPVAPAIGGTETVLLVEDDAAVRRLAEQALTRAGYRVLAATGAGEALRLAAAIAGPVDLVVTDVVMPEMPGPALVERLVGARPGLRVLYVSGYADDTVARYGLSEERVSFLAKPFSPETLARRVREVLDAGR